MKINVLIIFLIAAIVGCSNNEKAKEDDIVSKWVGKEIKIIDTLSVYNPTTNSYSAFRKDNLKPTLIIYIDGTCFTCAEDFVLWGDFIASIAKSEPNVLIYLNIHDLDTMIPYFSKWKFRYPILIDRTNSFYIANEISPVKLYQAMLLDKDDKVVLFGNPAYSKRLSGLYKRYLGI
jgi:hypothetical protein